VQLLVTQQRSVQTLDRQVRVVKYVIGSIIYVYIPTFATISDADHEVRPQPQFPVKFREFSVLGYTELNLVGSVHRDTEVQSGVHPGLYNLLYVYIQMFK
jgi:hypothetical protein